MASEKKKKDPSDDALRCSFCNKSQREVKKLIAGPRVFICDECVDICLDIIAEDRLHQQQQEQPRLPLKALLETLDQLVVGQPRAKRTLSAALYHHAAPADPRIRPGLSKSHILLVGPTGSGKTFLARTIVEHLRLPFATVDATRLTGESYFKEQDPFGLLLGRAGNDKDRAEKGVVFIDQLDRVACHAEDETAARRLQESLLSLLDGSVTTFTKSAADNKKIEDTIDTTGILFICSGTFRGEERGFGGSRSDSIGGNATAESKIVEKDLESCGLMPELVARFGMICTFDRLNDADMAGILRSPEHSPLDDYRNLFKAEGLELTFDDGAIEAIAREAARRDGGARSLRSVLEAVALELSFANSLDPASGQKLTVDADLVQRSLS